MSSPSHLFDSQRLLSEAIPGLAIGGSVSVMTGGINLWGFAATVLSVIGQIAFNAWKLHREEKRMAKIERENKEAIALTEKKMDALRNENTRLHAENAGLRAERNMISGEFDAKTLNALRSEQDFSSKITKALVLPDDFTTEEN